MARLTTTEAEELRGRILRKMQKWPNDAQSASEWRDSGFQRYSTAQMKRQLEIMVAEGQATAHRHPGIVYYQSAPTA